MRAHVACLENECVFSLYPVRECLRVWVVLPSNISETLNMGGGLSREKEKGLLKRQLQLLGMVFCVTQSGGVRGFGRTPPLPLLAIANFRSSSVVCRSF